MSEGSWHGDAQWARALGAVAIGFLLLCSVVEIRGPALALEVMPPVASVAARLHCILAAVIGSDGALSR